MNLNKFQSTHPHGVRLKPIFSRSNDFLFQSTHPHGVRLIHIVRVPRHNSFNPRTHMGCDYHVSKSSSTGISFNPRTHMGCDLQSSNEDLQNNWFQSTHPHGVRPFWGLYYFSKFGVSIHAPTWGATYSTCLSCK